MAVYSKQFFVTEEHSAKHWASGDLNVLSTPTLIAFMENAAYEYVQNQLPAEKTTVGAMVSIQHLAPTKIGQTVDVIIQSVESDGKKYHFDIEAYEGEVLIGKGTHTRAVITTAKFLERLG